MATVEFFRDRDRTEPVDDYFTALAEKGEAARVASFAHSIELLEDEGYPLPGDKLIDRKARIWETRIGPHRVAYAQVGEVIWLLHAWRKRSQKLDDREAQRAARRLRQLTQ